MLEDGIRDSNGLELLKKVVFGLGFSCARQTSRQVGRQGKDLDGHCTHMHSYAHTSHWPIFQRLRLSESHRDEWGKPGGTAWEPTEAQSWGRCGQVSRRRGPGTESGASGRGRRTQRKTWLRPPPYQEFLPTAWGGLCSPGQWHKSKAKESSRMLRKGSPSMTAVQQAEGEAQTKGEWESPGGAKRWNLQKRSASCKVDCERLWQMQGGICSEYREH